MVVYFPPASIFARLFRSRPYKAEIDNVYRRPGFPMNVGWLWPPKYKPSRPVDAGFLHEALRSEHAAYRRFYTSRDERLLGHVVLADPVIGALNLVQWLRVQAYHDAHHYERVRVRINNPQYAGQAAAAEEETSDGRLSVYRPVFVTRSLSPGPCRPRAARILALEEPRRGRPWRRPGAKTVTSWSKPGR